jgi:AcrR family transcriptional regulator
MRGPEDLPAPRREVVRQARMAGREAIRQARQAARSTSRQAHEDLRDVVRHSRELERAATLHVRGPGDNAGGRGEADTRSRIQQVALELFTEQGYEATSLREIAERLGVTKAALYYHFRTKDDIIASLVEDRIAKMEELISWAEVQQRTAEMRREFLRRYSEMLYQQGHHKLMRFFERNQSSMHGHKAGELMRDRMVRMLDFLSDRDAALPDQIRCSLAIFALHATWFVIRDPEVTDEQRRAAAMEVALGLVS